MRLKLIVMVSLLLSVFSCKEKEDSKKEIVKKSVKEAASPKVASNIEVPATVIEPAIVKNTLPLVKKTEDLTIDYKKPEKTVEPVKDAKIEEKPIKKRSSSKKTIKKPLESRDVPKRVVTPKMPTYVPPDLVKKDPDTTPAKKKIVKIVTSGLYPSGSPSILKKFMRRGKAKVESCFKRSLAQGRLGAESKYTVVVHCTASSGKVKVTNVTGSASSVGSFKRCVKRIGGKYGDADFGKSWSFIMHLLP
jgi:hypothetical protein